MKIIIKQIGKKYNQEMAIVIPACDKYLDIFAEYMRYFRMNWSDCPFEIVLSQRQSVIRIVG